MRKIIIVASALATAGCASLFDGTSQEITVNTSPPGAACTLNRNGAPLASISSTPGTVTVRKTKDDITVICIKDGFEQATFGNHSGYAAWGAGDVLGGLLLGGTSFIIDSATGADNKYDSPVNITLVPKSIAAR